MSAIKINPPRHQGLTVRETVPLPDGLIPTDARVEIEAKIAAGYRGGEAIHIDDSPSIGRTLGG